MTRTRLLTLSAIFAAMITITTAYIAHIPAGSGYIHIGDCLIFLAAALLPKPYAIGAAAIGGGLADLLTAPIWAPATILIKAVAVLPFSRKKNTIVTAWNIIAAILATAVTVVGYFGAEVILFGADSAAAKAVFLASAGPNLIQGAVNTALFIVIGLALDRIHFKNKFLK